MPVLAPSIPYANQPVGKVLRLYTGNRSAWDEHVQSLRVAVVGTLFDLPLAPIAVATYSNTANVLANALSGYSPPAFVEQLRALLKGHIDGTLKIVTATKADDQAALNAALQAAGQNAQQIGLMLSQMTGYPFAVTNAIMQQHNKLAVADLNLAKAGNFPGEDAAYKALREHALMSADQISSGVLRSLPMQVV